MSGPQRVTEFHREVTAGGVSVHTGLTQEGKAPFFPKSRADRLPPVHPRVLETPTRTRVV